MATIERKRRVGILVVSDTCFKDRSQDRTGPALRELVLGVPGANYEVVDVAVVPDEQYFIMSMVREWCDDDRLDVVVTAGGTGFAKRDVTPEAVKPLFDKEAPGLVWAMYAASFAVTPFAAMGRVAAGVRCGSIILCVPGSPKGATENVAAVIKLLAHASDLASDAVQSRDVHEKGVCSLEQQAGVTAGAAVAGAPSVAKVDKTAQEMAPAEHTCSHGHAHRAAASDADGRKSNALGGSVTRRARSSPYPMTSVDDALSMILESAKALPVEQVAIDDTRLIGRIVAEDIYAREAVPAYRASIVDGYAVVAGTKPGTYPVVGVSHAKPGQQAALKAGQVTRVTTGAPLPEGADDVVMVEDTKLVSSTADGREEREIEILPDRATGGMVREAGSDVKLGALVLAKGTRITASGGEIGVLASIGHRNVPCYRSPTVGVLSTGDELVEPSADRKLEHGEIRDSNRVSLLAAAQAHGYSTVDLGIAKDQPGPLEDVLRKALDRCDVIITTGGVSMGELDLLKPTLERRLGGEIKFGRVAMKPGKPTTFATVGEKLVFALPGNPASALVTFHLFVLPALRVQAGYPHDQASLPRVQVRLTAAVKLDPRPEYHRVLVTVSPEGVLEARSTGGQRSSRVGSLQGCNAFLCLPAKTTDLTELASGALVQAMMIGPLV